MMFSVHSSLFSAFKAATSGENRGVRRSSKQRTENRES